MWVWTFDGLFRVNADCCQQQEELNCDDRWELHCPLSTVQKPFYEKLLIFMLTLKWYFSGVYKYYSDHGLLKNSTTSHNSFHFLRVSLQLQLLDSVDLRRKEGSVEGAVVWGVGGEGGGSEGEGTFQWVCVKISSPVESICSAVIWKRNTAAADRPDRGGRAGRGCGRSRRGCNLF